MGDEQLLIGFDLSIASLGVIEVLCDDAPDEHIFFDVYQANKNRPEVLQFLLNHADTPEQVAKEISALLQLPVPVKTTLPERAAAHEADREKAEEIRVKKTENLLQKIKKLTVGERVHLAMKGGKEVRSILLKDSAKEVVKKVLENPRMTESEVEMITKSRSVSEDVLRIISKKKDWMKNYTIMHGLVSNPKTPAGIAMDFVKHLTVHDLDLIEKNKNVSQAVRALAKKLVKTKKPH